ncbi:unnamed protein product [Dracunculus medinensis]|uniref:Ig-like domain-containing protein n=1 Tax=Dracunculus medinensis TaxID=318479 RepID=A0A158Q306_DRAME|nr:unnamed protein product [Dracunculus medinensis]
MFWRFLLPFVYLWCLPAISMDKSKCGHSALCMFQPAGCNPKLDCTLGLILSINDNDTILQIQSVAQKLFPPVALQYIAIGFSKDKIMGDDMVIECILSDQIEDSGPEVFLSHNIGKSNDRIYLDQSERSLYFHNVSSIVIDGRLYCNYSIDIKPQIREKKDRAWDLNDNFYIFGVTGSAQPDDYTMNIHHINITYPKLINFIMHVEPIVLLFRQLFSHKYF